MMEVKKQFDVFSLSLNIYRHHRLEVHLFDDFSFHWVLFAF